MATEVCPQQCFNDAFQWIPQMEVKGNLPPTFCETFSHSTHSFLKVCDSPDVTQLPTEIVPVTVFDPSKNLRVPLYLRSIDTIGKLQQEYLKMRPELSGNLNLAYNGKPVQLEKTLGELKVKPKAVFITYQKCRGG